MNTIREIQKINEQELERGIAGTSGSWHSKYAQSAWVYVGNLDHSLTEGDVLCVLSQYGELEDVHLAREEVTGKSKGFGFAKYEDARSCVLAVDNLCGIQLCGRSLRIDHVENYRLPKDLLEKEEAAASSKLLKPGASYQGQELANDYSLEQGQDLFAPPPAKEPNDDTNFDEKEAKRKRKEERHRKRKEKEQRRREREQKRAEREERKREKRAKEMRQGKDEEKRAKKRRKKHRSRDSDRSRSRSESD